MKNLLLMFLISVTALSACRKKNNVNGHIGDRHAMLISKSWKIVSKKSDGRVIDIKDCEKDNYYIFNDNGFGTWEEGANNCFDMGNNGGGNNGGGSDSTAKTTGQVPTATEFTWSMTGDGRNIYIKNFGVTGFNPEWTIQNMDYTSLSVESAEHVNGTSTVYQIELRAQ